MCTDLTAFFKTITESVAVYSMFIVLILFLYLLATSFVKILCDNIIKVVLAARAPVTFKVKDLNETENS